MSKNWRECTLGDVIELKRGYDLPTSNRRTGSIPIISSSGPSGWHDEAKAQAPGVVTGRYGTIGQVFYIEEDFWPLNTTLYVRDFKGNDQRFVSYFLKSLDFQSFNDKSSVPGLNRNDLHLAPVSFPMPVEQRAIGAVLGSLDDKIEQNRRTGRKLEELARAVFKAWFVDFEPVKAKAAGATAFPGMPPETFAALPTRFTNSPLGPVPLGWEVNLLSDIADVIMGTSPPSDTYNNAGIGHALINGPVEYGDRFPLRVKWTKAPVKLAESGDLIFCVRGSTTGRRVLSDGIYGLGRGVCAIRSKHKAQAFVNILIDSELPRLLAGTTGSVFPSLSAPTIKGFEVVRPSTNAVRAFCEFADPMLQSVNAGAAESAKLAVLRDYLLPRLLSGRVRVNEAQGEANDAS